MPHLAPSCFPLLSVHVLWFLRCTVASYLHSKRLCCSMFGRRCPSQWSHWAIFTLSSSLNVGHLFYHEFSDLSPFLHLWFVMVLTNFSFNGQFWGLSHYRQSRIQTILDDCLQCDQDCTPILQRKLPASDFSNTAEWMSGFSKYSGQPWDVYCWY